MKKFLLSCTLSLCAALAGQSSVYAQTNYNNPAPGNGGYGQPGARPNLPQGANPGGYRCDGRTYCSQMRSCAEATWFLRNCPGTKMDGDNDGIPCESQWCGH